MFPAISLFISLKFNKNFYFPELPQILFDDINIKDNQVLFDADRWIDVFPPQSSRIIHLVRSFSDFVFDFVCLSGKK